MGVLHFFEEEDGEYRSDSCAIGQVFPPSLVHDAPDGPRCCDAFPNDTSVRCLRPAGHPADAHFNDITGWAYKPSMGFVFDIASRAQAVGVSSTAIGAGDVATEPFVTADGVEIGPNFFFDEGIEHPYGQPRRSRLRRWFGRA